MFKNTGNGLGLFVCFVFFNSQKKGGEIWFCSPNLSSYQSLKHTGTGEAVGMVPTILLQSIL